MAQRTRYDAAEAVVKNLPPPAAEPAHLWESKLETNDKLRVVPTLRNAYLVLANDPSWDGVLGFDQFSFQVMKLKKPPYDHGRPGAWTDEDDARTIMWLSHVYKFNVDRRIVASAVDTAAKDHPFHPVREWMNALQWDGTPRLDRWLTTYLGATAEDERQADYIQKVGVKWMVGAVARILRPAEQPERPVKMDSVLILEGDQGRWKSTALSVLAGPWFMDTPFTLGDKDAFLVIRGSLIVELAELDGFSRAESSRAKAFFSSPSDTYVPKYVAHAVKVPRQCVFAGTVNHGTYLRDTTGNRRYWPVRVQGADIDSLRADREQLWAEAVARYREGTRWWVEHDEREAFELEQALRYVGDPYEERLEFFLRGKTETTMGEIFNDALKLDTSKQTRAEATRVGEVLQSLGWEKRRRAGGDRGYFYAKRERQPGEEG